MHIYEKNGHKYPSVTTVLHIIGDEGICNWANSLGYRHISYNKELARLADFGTAAHAFVRALVDPASPKPDPYECTYEEEQKLKRILLKFKEFQKNFKLEPVFTEHVMVSDILEVGGTCDCYGSITIDGVKYENVLIDFKTAKKIHTPMFLQLSGYKMLLEEEGYKVDHCAIIQLNEDKIRLTMKLAQEIEEYREAFLLILKFFKFWIKENRVRELD